MARPTSRLAKLTRPDTGGLLARERLFRLLDRMQDGRFAWISGPAGAGKTSLATSWLDRRGDPVIWYRVDALDRDPATFFHYLALSVPGAANGRKRALPHLTPEYLAGLRDFARRYFRDFFARVPASCVLAFDNCHEAADSPFDDLVAWALEEAPPGVTILGISRREPGAPLARWVVRDRFVHVNADELRLDKEEASAIARSRGHEDSAIGPLLARVDGWTAGFVLLLRAQTTAVAASDIVAAGSQRALFDYFTREILAAADSRLREFLLHTAVLPMVAPSLAARLTGLDNPSAILEELHRNHFFTERRSQRRDERLYEYHPLFREFLLTQARAEFGERAFAAHCRKAAALLDESGRPEAAVALHAMAGDWPALTGAICAQAQELMQQGRWQILRDWIEALPADIAAAQPWILYWRGTCRCMVDPAAGKVDLAAAHRLFEAEGEPMGALLACAGALEAGYLELGDQTPSLPWIEKLDRVLGDSPTLPPPIEVRVIHSLLGAWFAQPQHPMLPRWAARAAELLTTLADPRGKAGVIAFAVGYYVWAGDFATASSVINRFDLDRRRAIEDDPISGLMLCIMKSGVHWQAAEHEAAYAMTDLAKKIAVDCGVHILDSFVTAQAIYTALSAGDLPRAEQELVRLQGMVDPRRRLDAANYGVLASGVSALAGRIDEAVQLVQREVPVADAMGAPFQSATFRLQCAQLLILNGQHPDAVELLQDTLTFARTMPSTIVEFQALLTLAWAGLRAGEEAHSRDLLREGLTIGRAHNYMNCHPLWIPEMMREVFAQALEADIETDYVRRFIRYRRLAPGASRSPKWPWPVRVYTLGRLEIRKDDVPLPSAGKAKQRVLDLLKAIIAHGPNGAPVDALAELLWPDAEGDAGRDALRVALHRLRKLLGDEQAVLVTEGKVLLNPGWCWVDAFTFEEAIDAARADPAAAARALEIYRSHFLLEDGERPWLVATRDRLRSKFLRAVEVAGQRLVQDGAVDGAIDLYRRATEIDPLAEGLYRRLMDCYARQGRQAEAIEAYRRCRQMLSVVLGVKPSHETQALHAALLAIESQAPDGGT